MLYVTTWSLTSFRASTSTQISPLSSPIDESMLYETTWSLTSFRASTFTPTSPLSSPIVEFMLYESTWSLSSFRASTSTLTSPLSFPISLTSGSLPWLLSGLDYIKTFHSTPMAGFKLSAMTFKQ
ncbi:hypothetical protein DPMN_072815 [Dreissena polymorpha]|uniref:Uncharacterized protein n=1 Tax=Dreissena polymorpha TaxID=45954 RepID=A0A9D4H9Z4_DREPO|nr:hypothetical protein DPMN_072815 [Dreissena polymorpha]